MTPTSRRQPFPKPGERLADAMRVVERPTPTSGDWSDDLWASLTIGGRILVSLVGVIGASGLLGSAADAVFGGAHGDQEGGVLLVFVALVVGALLAVVVGLDAVFRAVRRRAAFRDEREP